MTTMSNQLVVLEPGWSFRMMTVITMTAGSCFVMWLGEQITDRGIGQGASLIITLVSLLVFHQALRNLIQSMNLGQINLLEITMLLAFMVVVIGVIVFIERGQYRVPIQYAKKVVGGQVYGGQSTHLPLKVKCFWCVATDLCIKFDVLSQQPLDSCFRMTSLLQLPLPLLRGHIHVHGYICCADCCLHLLLYCDLLQSTRCG